MVTLVVLAIGVPAGSAAAATRRRPHRVTARARRAPPAPVAPPGTAQYTDAQFQALGVEQKCDAAHSLIRFAPSPWPIVCIFDAAPRYAGMTYAPIRIELYVYAGESQTELARSMAHEMGHMVEWFTTRHPSNPAARQLEWWTARGLSDRCWAPDFGCMSTWRGSGAEDFAESFARWQFPSTDWRATTPVPTAAQIAALASAFFNAPLS